MFGRETLRQENREVVAQKWNAFVNEDKALTVINCGSHGSSINAGKIGLTLLRSAGYSAADGNFERTLREERHTVRMEQGERIFRFRIEAGKPGELMDVLTERRRFLMKRHMRLPLTHLVKGKKEGSLLRLIIPRLFCRRLKRRPQKTAILSVSMNRQAKKQKRI